MGQLSILSQFICYKCKESKMVFICSQCKSNDFLLLKLCVKCIEDFVISDPHCAQYDLDELPLNRYPCRKCIKEKVRNSSLEDCPIWVNASKLELKALSQALKKKCFKCMKFVHIGNWQIHADSNCEADNKEIQQINFMQSDKLRQSVI